MRIIISPAKNMTEENDFLEPQSTPVFLKEAEQLCGCLKKMEYGELKRLLGCGDKLASLHYERYRTLDLCQKTTAAILSYDGIQYKYMAPQVFTEEQFRYVGEKLRILSGLYGIVRPFDGVVPYRLEMQAKLKALGCKNLYEYWGDKLYRALEPGVILNLASEEYSKAVRRYVEPGTAFITCVFGEWEDGEIREKGVYVKMARGEMVRYLAEIGAQNPEEAKGFDRLGYRYSPEHSREDSYVFLRVREKQGDRPVFSGRSGKNRTKRQST